MKKEKNVDQQAIVPQENSSNFEQTQHCTQDQSAQNGKLSRRQFLASSVGAAIGLGFLQTPSLEAAEKKGVRPPFPSIPAAFPFTRLSEPGKTPEKKYNIVVIGSGYGASVVASRLAERLGENKSICVLEKGTEWSPGMFPKNWDDLMKAVRIPEVQPFGFLERTLNPADDVDIVSGSGLGGTSLINAAISARPEPLVFQQKEWPSRIQELTAQATSQQRETGSLGGLDHFYKKAEMFLQPTQDPRADQQFAKVKVFLQRMQEHSVPTGRLALNLYRSEDGKKAGANSFGAYQSPCIYCGDCCSGCNVGAKNTLTMNYLPWAKKHNAHLFVHTEVTSIEKENDGYVVHYLLHSPLHFIPSRGRIKADVVILGAGSKGSTELLLRSQRDEGVFTNISRKKPFLFSEHLGSRLSGNGDVLGFSYNGMHQTNLVGYGLSYSGVRPEGAVGQLITTYGDYRKKPTGSSLQDRFLLLDATVPSSLGPKVATMLAKYALSVRKILEKTPNTVDEFLKRSIHHFSAFTKEQWDRVELDAHCESEKIPSLQGALNHSFLFLACGHDNSGGRYKLVANQILQTEWKDVQKQRFFQTINQEMANHAKKMNAAYVPNPATNVFKTISQNKIIVPHPLGGCPMSDDVSQGVVDHLGRVFDPTKKQGNSEERVHKGLYVVDGAIIPRSLGVPPLFTISALAERIAEHLVQTLA